LEDVLITEGCRVERAEIRHSVVGLRSQIEDGAFIQDSIIMGADYYETLLKPRKNVIPIGIGPGCHIEGAIIDKNARLGAGVTIMPFPRGTDIDAESWFVRDGIVVIPKDAVLPAGTHIEP
jgi:glucose-1-phosphate adenylyltransferase